MEKIEGQCAECCQDEMELVAGNADGSEGVCWQCADPDRDHAFRNKDLSLTETGKKALALQAAN